MRRPAWAVMAGVLTLVAASPGRAQAAPDFQVIAINDETMMVIDQSRTERRGDLALGWVVMVAPEEKLFRYVELRMEFDCKAGQQRRVFRRIFNDDHQLLTERPVEESWIEGEATKSADDLRAAACEPATFKNPRLESADVPELVDTYLAIRKEKMSGQ